MTQKVSPKSSGLAAFLTKEQNLELRKIIIECVKEANSGLYSQVNVLDQKTAKLDKNVTDLQEKMASVESETLLVKSKVTDVQKQQAEQERHLISLFWERSQSALRLQNVQEEEGERVAEVVSRLLAPLAELPEVQFTRELLTAYRVSTRYTEKNALPREIHLKLSGKAIRNTILYNANQKQLEHQGNKVIILKDVPLIVRRRREPFKKLAKQLLDKGLSYRWLIPQGLAFTFRGESVKITSIKDMDRFLAKYGTDFQPEEPAGATGVDAEKEQVPQKTVIQKKQLRPRRGR